MKITWFHIRLVTIIILVSMLISCQESDNSSPRAPVSELIITNIPSGGSNNRIVYLAEQDKVFLPELYLVDVATPTRSTKLNVMPSAQGIGVIRFVLSSDGTKVAYTADVDQLPMDTTVIGPAGPDRLVMFARFSPDGTQVAYTTSDTSFANTELFLTNLASPMIATKLNGSLTPGGVVGISAFKFSPDGTHVVYSAIQDSLSISTFGTFELYLVDLARPGVSTKINAPLVAGGNVGDQFESLFEFTADGNQLVYRADQDTDEMFELYMVDLAYPGVASKVNGPLASSRRGIYHFALSPDGTQVIYTADQGTEETTDLYVVALANPGVSMKLNPPLARFGAVTLFEISSDGNQVFYTASQDGVGPFELYVVELATPGVSIKLNAPIIGTGGDVERFEISSDGSQVVYTASTAPFPSPLELYLVNIGEPGTAIKLNTPLLTGGGVTGAPQFSPDHTHVAFLASDPETNVGMELFTVALAQPGTSIKLNGPLVSDGAVLQDEFEFVPSSP